MDYNYWSIDLNKETIQIYYTILNSNKKNILNEKIYLFIYLFLIIITYIHVIHVNKNYNLFN